MRGMLWAVAAGLLAGCAGADATAPDAAVLPVFTHVGNGRPHVTTYHTSLSGEAERPTPVETRARGQAILQLSRDGTELRYRLVVSSIENVTMAHIHVGGVETAGPVVAWLYPPAPPPQLIPGRTQGVLAAGVITAANLVGDLEGASLADLMAIIDAGGAYVNVHTQQFGAGEIRGQLP